MGDVFSERLFEARARQDGRFRLLALLALTGLCGLRVRAILGRLSFAALPLREAIEDDEALFGEKRQRIARNDQRLQVGLGTIVDILVIADVALCAQFF